MVMLDNLMSLVGSVVRWCKHDGHGLHLKKSKSQEHGIMVDHKGLETRIYGLGCRMVQLTLVNWLTKKTT